MLLNHPDFFSIWIGFSKIGVSCALINTNSAGRSLVHSVEISLLSSETKILIVDVDLGESISKDISLLERIGIKIFFWDTKISKSLKSEVVKLDITRIPKSYRDKIAKSDPVVYIFTSGTTGLPKACRISHLKYFLSGIPYRVFCNLTPVDKVYCPHPLYHSAAGMIGIIMQ